MTLNIKKVNRHKTVLFPPFGRVIIQDAKESVTMILSDDNVRHGKKDTPAACAISLCTRDNPDKFPGSFLAARTFKSFTIVATTINNKVQAKRYVHAENLRKAINGFDKGTADTLKAGDEITLMRPTKGKKLGESNGPSNNKPTVNKRPYVACLKRGVYRDPLHARQARKSDPDTKVLA